MSGLVHDTITCQVVGYGIAGPVKWIYDPADPHAVMMDLSVLCTEPEQQGQVVQWTFARSILVRGLVGGQAGIGDVRITRNGPWLDIALTSPDGHGDVPPHRPHLDRHGQVGGHETPSSRRATASSSVAAMCRDSSPIRTTRSVRTTNRCTAAAGNRNTPCPAAAWSQASGSAL